MTLAHPDRYATLDRGVPARVRRVAILRPPIAGEGPAMVGTFQALDLAAWARQGANRKVYLVDAHAEPLSEAAIIERLAASNPDAIVVCDAGERPAGELGPLLAAVHRGLPLSLLIVAREQGLEGHLPADIGSYHFLLTGDTGEGLRALLQHIETGRREPARISGLVWRDADGHIQGNPAWHVGSDLPASPLPAWDLMPRGFDGTFALRTAHLPGGCPTCHGAFGRTLRRRVIADVLHETQLLASGYGLCTASPCSTKPSTSTHAGPKPCCAVGSAKATASNSNSPAACAATASTANSRSSCAPPAAKPCTCPSAPRARGCSRAAAPTSISKASNAASRIWPPKASTSPADSASASNAKTPRNAPARSNSPAAAPCTPSNSPPSARAATATLGPRASPPTYASPPPPNAPAPGANCSPTATKARGNLPCTAPSKRRGACWVRRRFTGQGSRPKLRRIACSTSSRL
ncbi:MAG: hypothetical protein R3E96_11940 [Planctomycetota bacterium]